MADPEPAPLPDPNLPRDTDNVGKTPTSDSPVTDALHAIKAYLLNKVNGPEARLLAILKKIEEITPGSQVSNLPVGTIIASVGNPDPAYWVLCNGEDYLIQDKAKLYSVIGLRYGGVEGSFLVPDLRSNIPVANTFLTDMEFTYEIGTFFGRNNVQLLPEHIPHHHFLSVSTTSQDYRNRDTPTIVNILPTMSQVPLAYVLINRNEYSRKTSGSHLPGERYILMGASQQTQGNWVGLTSGALQLSPPSTGVPAYCWPRKNSTYPGSTLSAQPTGTTAVANPIGVAQYVAKEFKAPNSSLNLAVDNADCNYYIKYA